MFAVRLLDRRGFGHSYIFANFAMNLLNFQMSIAITRTLAQSSNLDENKDKESAHSSKLF